MYDSGQRRKTFDLAFREYGGLMVRTRRPSYRGLLLLGEAETVLGPGLASTAVTGVARVRALYPAVEAFADSLLEWTLLDDGMPVPATLAGVESQDYALVVDLVLTWYRRVALRPMRLDEVPEVDPSTNEPPADVEDDSDDLEAELAALRTFDVPADSSDSESATDNVGDQVDDSPSLESGPPLTAPSPAPAG